MRDTALERFKHDMESFEKAASRITATAAHAGGPELAVVDWLLKFLSDDLMTLNEWQRDEVFWNLYRFCWDGGQEWFTDIGRMGAMSLHYPETAAERTKVVGQIQRDARTALLEYLKTGVATFPEGAGAMVVRARGNPTLRYNGADLFSSFYWMAAQLLSRYGHRVKQCEGCPLIMLAGRKDQRFHSQNCQIASYFRTKRAKDKKDKANRLAQKHTKKLHKKFASHTGGKRHGTKTGKR